MASPTLYLCINKLMFPTELTIFTENSKVVIPFTM